MHYLKRHILPLLFTLFVISIVSNLCASPNSEQAKVDSVKAAILIMESDTAMVDAYNELAYHYGTISLDSSAYYLSLAKSKAQSIDYTYGLAVNHSYLARVAMQRAQFDYAIQNFDSAINMFVTLDDSVQLLDCYMGMAYLYNYKSKKLHSLEYNQKALPIAIALHDSARVSMVYNSIAVFYYRLGDYDNAYTYFRQSLDIEEQMVPQSKDIALSYSNLAMVLLKREEYDEARPIYNRILELLPSAEPNYTKPLLHLSLVAYYLAVEDLKNAENHLVEADSSLVDGRYDQLKARLYKRYGEWYFLNKDYAASIDYFNQSINIQQALNINEELADVYTWLAEAYYFNGDNTSAYQAMNHYKEVVQNSDKERLIYFLAEFEERKQAYELEQRELSEYIRNQKLELEAERLTFKYYMAIIIIVVLLATLFFGALGWVKKNKRARLLNEKNAMIKKQKLQLQEQLTLIQQNEAQLKHSNATKDKFLSIIAHDLRSPFSALIGFSDLIVEKSENRDYDKVLDYSKLINEVSRHSFALLNNLLDWAMEQAGKMSYNPEKMAVNAFLDEVLHYFKQLVPDRNIMLVSQLEDDCVVSFDHKMIQSVFRNLISNALKYTPEDGRIIVQAERRAQSIYFAVADTGVGMTPEQVEKLFRIEQAESTRGLKDEKGTGLGLILCKDFIEKHGGQIAVKSKQGKGTMFYFELPL